MNHFQKAFKNSRRKEVNLNVNVIVIGCGPAGIITALTAKSVYPEKSVCVIKEIGDGVIPCAIPYMMHTLKDPKQNAMGNAPLDKAGVDVIVGKVVSFDPKAHSVTLTSDQVLNYERLVLATGTEPVLPPIPGIGKEGVFTIRKSMSAMTESMGFAVLLKSCSYKRRFASAGNRSRSFSAASDALEISSRRKISLLE